MHLKLGPQRRVTLQCTILKYCLKFSVTLQLKFFPHTVLIWSFELCSVQKLTKCSIQFLIEYFILKAANTANTETPAQTWNTKFNYNLIKILIWTLYVSQSYLFTSSNAYLKNILWQHSGTCQIFNVFVTVSALLVTILVRGILTLSSEQQYTM